MEHPQFPSSCWRILTSSLRIGERITWSAMKKHGHRLALLVVEPENSSPVSTRKLLLESAKHTVITAFSAEEAIQTFERFPKVDAIIINGELPGGSRIAKRVKGQNPGMTIVCVDSHIAATAKWADKTADGHDPIAFLEMIENLGGRTGI